MLRIILLIIIPAIAIAFMISTLNSNEIEDGSIADTETDSRPVETLLRERAEASSKKMPAELKKVSR